jgi:hypothetical protein
MHIAKNMEAIFLVAVVLVSSMGLANAGAPTAQAAPVAHAASDSTMTVVTVSAKRLSPAQKAQLGN